MSKNKTILLIVAVVGAIIVLVAFLLPKSSHELDPGFVVDQNEPPIESLDQAPSETTIEIATPTLEMNHSHNEPEIGI